MDYSANTRQAIDLLHRLISIPSVSRNEAAAADAIEQFLCEKGYNSRRIGNNIICRAHNWVDGRNTIMLNSHIDTVKPAQGWVRDPFTPIVEENRLYGLGSNDDGGGLVCLMQVFMLLDSLRQQYNLLFVATAEEEISGAGGMKQIASLLPPISVALIGEPTDMQPAVAEKGLMVLDIEIQGRAGHAARAEGINAIERAVQVMSIIRHFTEELQVSQMLGPVMMTPTIINSGTQHNVIPDLCRLTVDVRSNDLYPNRTLLDSLCCRLPEWCSVQPRSTCLNPSCIDTQHPLIQRAVGLGLKPFGSPTLSDQSLLSCPSFKMGPGNSSRSHTADEYITLTELSEAIPLYMSLLDGAVI